MARKDARLGRPLRAVLDPSKDEFWQEWVLGNENGSLHPSSLHLTHWQHEKRVLA